MPGARNDLGRWLDVIGDLLREPLTEFPHEALLPQLLETFRAEGACWTYRTPAGYVGGAPWRPQFSPAAWLEFVNERIDQHPLMSWFGTTGVSAAWTVDRVPAQFVDPRFAEWTDLLDHLGLRHEMAMPLYHGPVVMEAFVVTHPEEDFTDDDVQLARRLQPLLAGLARQARTLARYTTAGSDEIRAELTLTGRELAVLGLVADGLTAVSVGRRLQISPRTVHKHLEHIYAKLRSGDRLTAVLKARQLGLLPTPGAEPVW